MGIDDEQRLNRRSVLKIGGAGLATGLSGCLGFGTPAEQPSEPTTTARETPEATPSPTPTKTPRFPVEGTLNPQLDGGEPWPDHFFNGNVDLEIELTAVELREKYHWDQYQTIADVEESEVLREFPHKLTDPEWVEENIWSYMEEKYDKEVEDWFHEDEFTAEDEPLDVRLRESGYPWLWRNIEIMELGDASSTNDYVLAAELAAAEYYSTGTDTIVTEHKTTGGGHGLGLAITGATYDPERKGEQETWGLETDPNDPKQIWDADEAEDYTNKNLGHFLHDKNPESSNAYAAWQGLGLREIVGDIEGAQTEEAHLDIQLHGADQFEDFLRNPDTQLGMKYLDSICLASHIYNEAHKDGKFPEFEGAVLSVGPGQIQYELA